MYCGQCGTQNNEEAGHCETCGAPLLITAGARTCATCGSSLGDHDRFCPTCGSPSDDAIDASTYDASDDFGELDIGDIEISDLPDWLKEMAPESETAEPVESPEPAQPSVNGVEQSPPDDLPDWLQGAGIDDAGSLDSAATSRPAEASGVDHQPADQFSLVSDEDLPEWLRALGDEEPDEAPQSQPSAQQPAAQVQPQQTSAVATLFDVPPINRAWHAQGRQVDETQVSTAQQEFSPLEIVSGSVASAEAAQTQVWDADSMPTEPFAAVDEGQRPHEPQQQKDASGGPLSTRTRQIAAIVVLAILVLVTLVLAFILVQGMV